ncbi:MAG: glycine cleavage system protein GcvH [Actinomycetaceae bacterium]|nr:glycine cleavage system protein GcvH [Actinomycetaceae bacterium]
MSDLPVDYSYSSDHEWVNALVANIPGSTVRIGITSFATEQLGDVVFLDLPEVGDTLTAGDEFGEVESTKSVSTLYAPVSGTVTAVNDAAIDDPSIVNAEPFDAGWLIEVTAEAAGDLLDAQTYAAQNQ